MTVLAALTLATTAAAGPKPDRPEHWQPGRGNQAWQWNYRVWMPGHWQRLAQCESGSNPPAWSHLSAYEGAFGMAPGTWDSFKPVASWPSSAHLASPWQQWRTALRVAARYGIASPWGCWRGPQHAWVRGNLPEYGVYR